MNLFVNAEAFISDSMPFFGKSTTSISLSLLFFGFIHQLAKIEETLLTYEVIIEILLELLCD